MSTMSYLPRVTGAAVIGDFQLRLMFSDGTVGDVDLANELDGRVFEPLRDPAFFCQVRVDPEGHTIVWPNGADMAPETLYDWAKANPLTTSRTAVG